MIFYYGSEKIVEKPIYNYGNPSNDYGLGFYLTKDKNVAKLWASKNINGGYLLRYDVDISKYKILDLDGYDNDSVLKWITLLIKHRFSNDEYDYYKDNIDLLNKYFSINIDNYDMIVGYRADDAYFSYSRDFVANNLSIEKLALAIRLGKLGKQYVLKSERAFKYIKLIDYERIEHDELYASFRQKLINEYHIIKNDDDINNTYIRDIIREKMRNE